ncbi:MAG: acyl-CoA/acyl-ACP dehydrogenase [Proteobacteria bacterium]|nr:acyl-CoA/acyl-ACP dehydrogenase [Pseudomonadota bacterium]
MNFGLSEEQELLQQTIDQFLANECPPARLHEIFDGEEALDAELWRGLMELGLGGLAISESHGGAGLEMVDLALACEVLGRHAAPGPYLGHALAGVAIELGGSDAQKERWLPRLAAGDALATLAFAEPGGIWDPSQWRAAVRDGRVDGVKEHVLGGSAADLWIVGCAGGDLALVERGAEGAALEPFDGLDRSRRLDRLALAGTPCELLERGAAAAQRVRDAALCLLSADAFGGASRSLEMAVEFAQQREQFGVTIAHFQAVKHQLADLASEVEPARALFWYAAHAWDARPEQSERAAALAKAHVAERFVHAAYETAEIFGGIGVTWEGDIQIWLKRALFDRVYFGDTESHRERAARLADW